MPEHLSYQYPQYSLSERQDAMLYEYDRHLEPIRYKPNHRTAEKIASEFNNHLDFFCTMNSISIHDIKRHIQYLENQLIYHPIVPTKQQSNPSLRRRIEELDVRLANLPEDKPNNESSTNVNICDLCMEAPKRIAFRCGHIMCEDCSPKLTVCPTCRVPITDRIKLYM